MASRALAVGLATVLYVIAFWLFHDRGAGVGLLVALPVLLAGSSFGWRAGGIAALAGILLNVSLRELSGEGWQAVLRFGGLPGAFTLLAVGAGGGWMRDMNLELAGAKKREVTAHEEARLLRADRLAGVGVLAGGVAHHINNPLASVVANVGYVRRLPTGERGSAEAEEALKDALAGAERIRAIVAALQTFAAGSADGKERPCDVNALLERVLLLVKSDVERRGRLVVDFTDLPPVRGNEARLAQVFVNLLINAADALAPDGASQNEVRVGTRWGEDRTVVVEVSDTGTGIPADVLPWIFDPFFSTKSVGAGTGLGLSVAAGIVKSLGGRIDVESEPKRGTTFRVSLPAYESALEAERVASAGET